MNENVKRDTNYFGRISQNGNGNMNNTRWWRF